MDRFAGKHVWQAWVSRYWNGVTAVLLILFLLNLIIQYSDLKLTYNLSYRRGVSQLPAQKALSAAQVDSVESAAFAPWSADFVMTPGQAILLSVISRIGQGEITLQVQAMRENGRFATRCDAPNSLATIDCIHVLPEATLEK